MIFEIINLLGQWIINVIKTLGYKGVFILMLLESAAVPIPSEIIMPFAGSLISKGIFNFWLIVSVGVMGNLVGSILLYFIGKTGGRYFLEKYGKYLLIHQRHLKIADDWFYKHGDKAIFFGRILPIIRTFISLPAGVSKTNFGKFCFYTILGCIPWNIFLTFFGLKLGENWQQVERYFRKFDIIILSTGVVAIVIYIIKNYYKNNRGINNNV